jgi:hypothetical protein
MTGAAAGLLIMAVSEIAAYNGIQPFHTWNTPICWTGFILFADSLVYHARGTSWIRSSPREFLFLALASVPLWLVFELYNLFLDNWHYVGLPDSRALRYIGYTWSFATIWPAIFEAADLVAVWRGPRKATARLLTLPHTPLLSSLAVATGAALLAWPILTPSRYLAAPVWLGFILLLAPINRRAGADTLLVNGRPDRVINLVLAGFLCGLLWEFWNYWSGAKWLYTVPILEDIRIFEMPVLGYFGFPAFAVECFTMYVSLRALVTRLVPRTAPFLRRRIALS